MLANLHQTALVENKNVCQINKASRASNHIIPTKKLLAKWTAET